MRKRPLPKYCPICRKVHYAKQAQERKQKENQEWQRKKAEDVKRYYSALKDLEGQFDIIPLEHVVPVHMAHPNGRVCGAKRPKCEAERSHHL